MVQSINLIPQEEKAEQAKESVVRFSSVISVVFLLVVIAVSGFYWFRNRSISNQIDVHQQNIEDLRTDISALSEIEVVARSLDAKYKTLDEIYKTRRKYSTLLSELEARVPETVSIDSFSLSGDELTEINISGKGQDYLSIARFLSTLSDKQFPQAGEGFENLFTDVSLNSVNLDSQSLSVSYFIVVTFDEELLPK